MTLRTIAISLAFVFLVLGGAASQELTSAESLRPAIVKIIVQGTGTEISRDQAVGSGFVVASGPASQQTFVATASHVIAGPGSGGTWETDDTGIMRRITVYFYDSATGTIRADANDAVVAFDDGQIALLSIPGGSFPSLRLVEQYDSSTSGLLMGFDARDQVATTVEGSLNQEQGALFGRALRLNFLARYGQSGGPVVGIDSGALAIANYNTPKGAPTYHVAFTVNPIIEALRKLGIDPRKDRPIPYRNGLFAGTWRDGLPWGKGTFSFEPGQDAISGDASIWWTLTGNFVSGEPDGEFTLTGPIAQDSRPQSCKLVLVTGRIDSGTCSIFVNNFASPLGVDPRVKRDLAEGLEVTDESNQPGSTTFTGRYEGTVTGGKKSIFEPSDYLIKRLSEEHILPHGAGTFEVSDGWAMMFFVNAQLDVGFGPMILDGHWLLGSFTGEGSVRMPNGSVLKGTFDSGYIQDGEAIEAFGHVFGTAVDFYHDKYTGHMRGGWMDGTGVVVNDLEQMTQRGEFRRGFLRNGTMIYNHDNIRWCTVWTEGEVTAKHDMSQNATCP